MNKMSLYDRIKVVLHYNDTKNLLLSGREQIVLVKMLGQYEVEKGIYFMHGFLHAYEHGEVFRLAIKAGIWCADNN